MIALSILFLIVASNCYALQGNWSLTSVSGLTLGPQKIVLEITDLISPQQQILQQLAFYGCGQLQQQAEFSEGQVFLSSNSALTKASCDQPDLLTQLAQQLGSIFFFQLNIDQLLFNDPYGSTVMSFQRLLQATPVKLTGIWTMNQYANTMTSISVQFSPTQIILCQGNLVLNYTLYPSANIITLAPVVNKCPSVDLTTAVLSSKYFRVNNGILDLYDKSVSLTTELVYSTAYDPAKPLFAITVAAPTAIATSPIAGAWAIASLFNIPFPTTPYSLSISQTSISLQGGCNNYSFSYLINTTSQIISIGNSTSSTSSCAQSDDQLYVSGIQKIYKYVLTKSAASTLSFYDQQGNIGYILKTPVPSTPTPASSTQSVFSSGTYLFLLLKRRDLPRMLVTISGNSITYQGCNTIKHTFSPAPLSAAKTGQISISGETTTTNNCSINNDKIYIQALNQSKSYTFDPNAGTVIFSDASDQDLVTFSASSK